MFSLFIYSYDLAALFVAMPTKNWLACEQAPRMEDEKELAAGEMAEWVDAANAPRLPLHPFPPHSPSFVPPSLILDRRAYLQDK